MSTRYGRSIGGIKVNVSSLNLQHMQSTLNSDCKTPKPRQSLAQDILFPRKITTLVRSVKM